MKPCPSCGGKVPEDSIWLVHIDAVASPCGAQYYCSQQCAQRAAHNR